MNTKSVLTLLALGTIACRTPATKDDTLDNDGDGYEASEDCDDNNPTMPAYDRDCDGISGDFDCDDNDAESTSILTDADCDGALTDEDCDDNDPDLTAIATDADCDGALTDEDCDDNDPAVLSSDNDRDCDGWETAADCDDNDPDATAIALDNDCDGALTDEDCNDNDPTISNATEYTYAEEFTQGTNKTDIVIALDTSCSMYDDMVNMKDTFSAFVDVLNNNNQDYHISAVVDDDGCVNGSVTHIDNSFSTADAESAFEDMVVSSAYASNAERPFMMMEAFLNEAVDSTGAPLSTGCNAGAIRQDAQLALIGVSDEPDQSYQPYTYYVSAFQGFKNNSDDVTFYSLGGICTGGNAGMENAAIDTDGEIYDICTSVNTNSGAINFWNTFGNDVLTFGDAGVFQLGSEAASATEFTVTVDGQAQNFGWSYESLTNSIVFDASSMPPNGSLVQVTYSWSECL